MLNSSHKSISPEKKLLRLFPIVRAPSINRTWEILSGTIPTGQKLQRWEEKRAVPRAGSPFIWCVHGNSSLEWRKQGNWKIEVLFRCLKESRYEKCNLKPLLKEMLKLKLPPFEVEKMGMPSSGQMGCSKISPLCVIYRIHCYTKGWLGDEICMKIASDPSGPPTKPSGGATLLGQPCCASRKKALVKPKFVYPEPVCMMYPLQQSQPRFLRPDALLHTYQLVPSFF